MIRTIVPISALILGSAFLMFAGGINGLILPIRGNIEGFSDFSLGLLGAGWATGYMGGCVYTPYIVKRVGHIRAFCVLATLAAITILATLLLPHPLAWVPLRALAGFCFSGAAMIFESWLNERANSENRGRVFGSYMMVNLVATTLGQMAIILGDLTGYLFFVVAGIFYALSLLPPALTRVSAPNPLVQVKLDLGDLIRTSHFATITVVLTGVSNGAFLTLGAVYGQRLELDIPMIVLFMSLALLTGAVFQWPVGYLSDNHDRRLVLVWIAVFAAIVDLFFSCLSACHTVASVNRRCILWCSHLFDVPCHCRSCLRSWCTGKLYPDQRRLVAFIWRRSGCRTTRCWMANGNIWPFRPVYPDARRAYQYFCLRATPLENKRIASGRRQIQFCYSATWLINDAGNCCIRFAHTGL